MKKALSWLIIFSMAISLSQVRSVSIPVKAADENVNATFIANRWVPVGFYRDGKILDGKTFPWQRQGEVVWGRQGFGMPDSLIAIDNDINIPADLTNRQVDPLFWTEFYLTVKPMGGKSQESEHWYAIYDSAGQIWLDPDGYFNDSRYYEPADPVNFNGKYITGLCKNNPLAKVDSSAGNNTQGPYILDPENPRFDLFHGPSFIDSDGNTMIYFWDTYKTKRVFRMAWGDLVDYPLERGEGSVPPIRPSEVQGTFVATSDYAGINDWDAEQAYPLYSFRYFGTAGATRTYTWWNPNLSPAAAETLTVTQPAYDQPPDTKYYWYYNSVANMSPINPNFIICLEGDELHTDNISTINQNNAAQDPVSVEQGKITLPAPIPASQIFKYYAKISDFDPGEHIYRKGHAAFDFPSHSYFVQEHDLRLTPVSIYYNGEVRNYPPNSYVKQTDWDCAYGYTINATTNVYSNEIVANANISAIYKNIFRFRTFFDAAGGRLPNADDEVHVDNVKTVMDSNWSPGWFSYETGEWIYRDQGTDLTKNGKVTVGDQRLTNVNGIVDSITFKKDRSRGQINSDVQLVISKSLRDTSNPYVPRVFGDALILQEVLRSGCNQPLYNISIETDLWEGQVPDVTAASLRTPNGDFEPTSQVIQRSTVLDPDGSRFNIPATTFQNISIVNREYIGLQLWKDDGIDNSIGMNFMDAPPPPIDTLFPYNLDDDYRSGRTGEEFLGANNNLVNDKDLNRREVGFPRENMFFDIKPINLPPDYQPIYGCGEAIYRNVNTTVDTLGNQIVNNKDIRLTKVTVTKGSVVVSYEAGTEVSTGDADYGYILSYFTVENVFYDKSWPAKSIPLNNTYDPGEDVYQVDNVEKDLIKTYIPDAAPFFFGAVPYDSVLYFDADTDSKVSPGDIRVYDSLNVFSNGSLVSPNIMINPDLNTQLNPQQIFIRHYVENGYILAAYLDRDNNNIISTDDVRLNLIFGYQPYTVVAVGDKDNNSTNPLALISSFVHFAGVVRKNQLIVGTDYPNTPNPSDGVRITPYLANLYDIRLSSVTISDVTYECGSTIGGVLDFWVNENPIHGLTMGKNSSFRSIDWEVIPSSQVGMNVKIEPPLKVEQTSQIDININPAPKPARWEDGKFYPAEKVYVYILDSEGPNGLEIYEDLKVVTSENPFVTFQFTPYRGSCPPNGQSFGWRKIYNVQKRRYELKQYDLRMKIVAIKDMGGVDSPVPLSIPIVDPFASMHDGTKDHAGTIKGGTPWLPPPFPTPPLPAEILHSYDCYGLNEYNILPEDITVNPSKKCLSLLDQKFPNFYLRLSDANNPSDVNDPDQISISVPKGEEVVAFYNAHSSGVDFVFSGYLNRPLDGYIYGTNHISSNMYQIDTNQKIIGQYNLDGTILLWFWNDSGFYPGMLDGGDFLWVPNPAYNPLIPEDGPSRLPGYMKIIDKLSFKDNDCSIGSTNCKIYEGSTFNMTGTVSYGDSFGEGDLVNPPPIFITTYGVPTYLRSHGEPPRPTTDIGGEVQIAVLPRDSFSKLQLQVYTYNVIFDYNSSIQHPPFFIVDEKDHTPKFFEDSVTLDFQKPGSGTNRYLSMGIDYATIHEFKVVPSDPNVNFAEMSMIDHGLQNSQVNYTAGIDPTSALPAPTPQIQFPYNPIVQDASKDVRSYPGGQTHTGRISGGVLNGGYIRSDDEHNGWNAYPAIWWWYWYGVNNISNFTDFNKLGTEFFPLTDYGAYFILKDLDGNHLSFTKNVPLDKQIRRIEFTGPFATPKVFDQLKQTYTSTYEYNATRHVPIVYDWSGKIIIDHSNSQYYEMQWYNTYYGRHTSYDLLPNKTYSNNEPYDWTKKYIDQVTNTKENTILRDSKRLDYRGLNNIIRIEEIIPISAGLLSIKVIMNDGTIKIFQDCCAEPPTDGVDVHALDIKTDVETITADQDNKVIVTLKENEVMQEEKFCNSAFVYIWQDRGVINRTSKLYDGAGDGWITNPPHSSHYTSLAPQYLKEEDLNNDGKISFRDYETEIIGTYDLATNTWNGGVIDARTFQRNNGEYVFDLSETNGARVNTVGIDFGGAKGTPDHVISEFEALPVMVTAYKYGDDNNDRSFEPLYGFPGTTPQHSHEVYLSGQKFIEVSPIMDLSVSVQPNPLTAGVTPELVDPLAPLMFVLTNEEGNPVDLTKGVADATGRSLVETDDVWNYLFHDIHPSPLPEYYWLRTDLHNDDGTRVSNRYLYSPSGSPFQPITPDFTLSKDGKYSFRGFCANDEGTFDVIMYTPDRKHAAKATVNVVLPTAEYAIVNTEDISGTEFQVPGDPDFMLTSADNRLYRIRVTAKNAQGLMLKGVTKGVSTCGGGIENATRFTPYSTRPSSYDFTERDRYLFAEHFLQDLYPYTLNIGFDFNDNAKVDLKNAELYNLGGFIHTASKLGQITLGQVYYNTTLIRYDEQSMKGGWDVVPNPNLVPPTTGWGLGSIYNSAHRGGYLFADIDENKRLDYHDSLGLDVNAQTTFYIFAEDLVYLGGLIGDNVYCNNPAQGDLAGYPPAFKTDPATIYTRFDPAITPDGVFMLDWEAFPNKEVQIAPPNLKVLDAKTRIELGKDLLNTVNYDLVYAIENHLIVEVRPADIRDLPMRRDGRVFMIGNQHQTAIYGKTEASPTDPKVMETTLHFTPTGIGENVAYMGYFNKNMNYLVPPYDFKNTSTYTLRNLLEFDSIVGLQLEVSTDGPLHPNKSTGVQVKVTEIGSNAPVEGATVTLKGLGVNATGKTAANGIASFTITPNDKGIILVTATMEGKHIGTAELRVSPDSTAPWIELDPLPPFTNKPQTEVLGRTNPGNTVTLNGSTVQVAQDGSFKGNVPLKEGLNTIVGEAKDKNGLIARKMITITLDTTPPNIFIDDPGYLVEITELEVTGRVEPNSTLTVNGITAKVVFDIWKTEDRKIEVKPGKNLITVVAVDQAGNTNTATKEILVYKRTTIQLTIENIIPIIDGKNQPPLDAAPFILAGRTMVPIRFVSEAFGAKVDYDAATKGITITMNDTVIAMQIGNTNVMVNGKSFTIDAPPVIRANRTFVPIRFISEILNAKVSYEASTRTVTIVRDYLP